MNSMVLLGPKMVHKFSHSLIILREIM